MWRRRVAFWGVMTAVAAGAGVLYGFLFNRTQVGSTAVYGVAIGLTMMAFHQYARLGSLDAFMRRQSSPVFLGLSLVIYVALIATGTALAGALLWSVGEASGSLADAVRPSTRSVLYSLVIASAMIFVLRVQDLIGHEVFLNLLIGRYHRPVSEERVFLFLDLVGSTEFAESEGDVRAQDYLGAFFAALAEPVRRHRGLIDDYVGDMALVTWPLERGVAQARCLRCVLDLAAALERQAPAWQARFGSRPRFRAALHCGPVVTAEIGVDRHKITYFGDTVNTTARLEALGKALNEPVLVSADLLARIQTLPPGVTAADLGTHALRGRAQRLAVSALRHPLLNAVPGTRTGERPAGSSPSSRRMGV